MSYAFSLDFQKHILASVITDADFFKGNADVIRPEFFGDEILAGICDTALTFWKVYKTAPGRAGLFQELKKIVAPGRKLHEYKDELDEIYKLAGDNPKYYQEQAVAFARSQAVSGALRAAVPLVEHGDLEEIGRLVGEALKVGGGLDAGGVYDYFGMAADRVRYYLNGHSKEGRVGTGLSTLDDCMGGGLAAGELGVIVALPGFGKSTTLVNFGARALLQNKRVAHITLELSRKMIAAKYDNCLVGRTLDHIKNEPKEFAHSLRELRDRLTGKLYIIEAPTGSLTIDKIQGIVEKLDGIDLLIIDYAQLIRPARHREHTRNELTETYKELRGIAGTLKVPLWTAHQANRPGTDSKVLRMEHIAEDFNVAATSDICISVNHSEEEFQRGTMRFFIMKSRIGPSRMQINMTCNFKTCRITQA